ncbi:MAG: hypothetical protein L3J11_08705 [Draconibacterium sp.]|nr:hypothetical protein [Draconibacterium sp.]
MINYKITRFIFVGIIFLFSAINLVAQVEKGFSDVPFYEKKEFNTGLLFYGNSEREELRTDVSSLYEEIASGFPAFQFKSSFWNFLDYKQDFLEFNFEVGPFYGVGNGVDSTFVENIEADQTQFGVRANFSVDYSSRYYYNDKNYTIVEVGAWARSQLYKQNSKGSAIDSSGIVSNVDESSNESKFRYGFEAKAGWGWGRLNAMNNYMLAQYILEKYYAGRIFSEVEIRRVAAEIYNIKDQRDIVAGHNNELEAQLISDFLNENMLLTVPEDLEVDWEMAEFKPRLQGARVELGPFFKYFNREPDFIYGGYIQYENKKYRSLKWNRNFSAGIKYNRYKKQDWLLAELNIGWTYFPNLKRQFDFGVKYVPGVEVNNFSKTSGFNHGLVPYVGYFSQINSKSRVNFTFAYRISQNEKIMLPGPEFSFSVYRSRY